AATGRRDGARGIVVAGDDVALIHAEVHVGIDDTGQHHFARGIERLRGVERLQAERRDAAVFDADAGLGTAARGDDQTTVDREVVAGARGRGGGHERYAEVGSADVGM